MEHKYKIAKEQGEDLIILVNNEGSNYSVYEDVICLDDCGDDKEFSYISKEEVSVLLDCLYEQAHYQEHTKGGNKVYAQECRHIAKKLEKFLHRKKRG